jgi:hypothetical protein
MTYLDAEIMFFEDHRAAWLAAHEGEWAVVRAGAVKFFKTELDAYAWGRQNFGMEAFLLRQVLHEYEEESVTRSEFLDELD